MSRIYSSTNRIKFTDIPEKYAVPRTYKGKQCELHSAVVTYVYDHFQNTKRYRQTVVDALNRLTYCLINNSPPPYKWSASDPLDTMPDDIDIDTVEKELGELCLSENAIEWDVSPVETTSLPPSVENVVKSSKAEAKLEQKKPEVQKPSAQQQVVNRPLRQMRVQQTTASFDPVKPTPKEDLYIQSPRYPRFDYNKVWLSANDGNDKLVIYTTLPEIPTRQNEISVTTNVDAMTYQELMRLYPNQFIRTRSPKMYEKYEGIDFDEELGCIFPIEGFSRAQVIDNIICYPHLYKLKKVDKDGKILNFYSSIEIGGELYPIGEIWDTLPDSQVIPRDTEFVKEYVVRRYLLEERMGVEHQYKMLGVLDPFLTLFMPPAGYIARGYKDVEEIVKQCVRSRVRYKQSRNPILRRLNANG